MKKYRANQPMTLRDGLVALTDEQLRRRFGHVRPTKQKGVYEITGECRFKAGEEFAWTGEPPKADTALFGEVEPPEPAADEPAEATGDEAAVDEAPDDGAKQDAKKAGGKK